MTFNEPFESIDSGRLQSLIDDGVPETAMLEYKRETYGNRDKDRQELSKDISALANTLGGDLFIGIDETDGIATALTPLPVEEADKEQQRLEQIIRNTIDPALVGLQMQRIRVNAAKSVLEGKMAAGDAGACPKEGAIIHIRVPRSVTPPHRVTAQNHNRFYGRNSAGTHELSMPDLRRLFGQERDMYDRARAFIGERFLKVQAGDTPVPVKQTGSGLVMHLVPLMDFAQGRQAPMSQLQAQYNNLEPIDALGWGPQINLEGFSVYKVKNSEWVGYSHLFPTCAMEVLMSDPFVGHDGKHFLPAQWFPETLMKYLSKYLVALENLQASPPIAIATSLYGTRGLRLGIRRPGFDGKNQQVSADQIRLPTVILQDIADSAALRKAIRDQMDLLWNAFGYEKCFFFDDEGNWSPPR